MKGKIILIAALTTILMYIPYVNVFFQVLNTLFHEGGHALAALFTKGDVMEISLFSNTEGVTTTSSDSWFSFFFTAIFGYVFASFIGWGCTILWSRHKHKTMLTAILVFSVVNLVFWVRNPYGILWLVISSLLLGLAIWKVKKESVLSSITLTLSIILVTQSVLSAIDILYLSYVTPSDAGDASNLANLTFIPGIVWGILFVAQALFFAFLAIRQIWRTKENLSLRK